MSRVIGILSLTSCLCTVKSPDLYVQGRCLLGHPTFKRINELGLRHFLSKHREMVPSPFHSTLGWPQTPQTAIRYICRFFKIALDTGTYVCYNRCWTTNNNIYGFQSCKRSRIHMDWKTSKHRTRSDVDQGMSLPFGHSDSGGAFSYMSASVPKMRKWTVLSLLRHLPIGDDNRPSLVFPTGTRENNAKKRT